MQWNKILDIFPPTFTNYCYMLKIISIEAKNTSKNIALKLGVITTNTQLCQCVLVIDAGTTRIKSALAFSSSSGCMGLSDSMEAMVIILIVG